MEQSNITRRDATWDCSVCGRSRQCPYSAPCLSGKATESCRTCGDTLVSPTPPGDAALRAAICNHLI